MPDPAPTAPAQPDPITDPPADPPADPKPQGDPAGDGTLGENGTKALAAERKARSAAERREAELKKQLDAINAANMSDLEKAQKAAADAAAEVASARAEALRFRIASKHGISDDDAELFLTGTDEDTLERQATRLADRTPATPGTPRPDPSQGAKSGGTSADPAQQFAQIMKGQLAR